MRAGLHVDSIQLAYARLRSTLGAAGIRTLDEALAHPVYSRCVCNLAAEIQHVHARRRDPSPRPQLKLL